MKKTFILAICFVMLFPVVASAAFTDVQSGHWAESYINELTEKGVINGMGDGTFNPDGTLTKGQFIKLIMEASIPGQDFSIMPTTSDHWAAPYAEAANVWGLLESGEYEMKDINIEGEEDPEDIIDEEIVEDKEEYDEDEILKEGYEVYGGDKDDISLPEEDKMIELPEINYSNFDEPITRIEVVKILSKADINIKGNAQKNDVVLLFDDINDLTVSERIMLVHAVSSGVINGYPDDTFRPNNVLTRAEASKIISIFMGL